MAATRHRTFGLVLKRLEVKVDTPAELVHGCVLRRPTDAELTFIKGTLSQIALGSPVNLSLSFEMDPPPGGGSFVPLERKRWRYWVVEHPSTGVLFEQLFRVKEASLLCDVELPCNAMTFGVDDAGELRVRSRSLVLPPLLHEPAKPLDEGGIEQLKYVSDRLSDLRKTGDHKPILAAVNAYTMLASDLLRRPHPLFVFGILESILTHDPKGGYDSLTHQVSTKMVLLNKRFEKPLDYSCFKKADEPTIWKKLYAYRSCIAHGASADFGGTLEVLKDARTANAFLIGAIKVVLRHALKEPQLVLDLREC